MPRNRRRWEEYSNRRKSAWRFRWRHGYQLLWRAEADRRQHRHSGTLLIIRKPRTAMTRRSICATTIPRSPFRCRAWTG